MQIRQINTEKSDALIASFSYSNNKIQSKSASTIILILFALLFIFSERRSIRRFHLRNIRNNMSMTGRRTRRRIVIHLRHRIGSAKLRVRMIHLGNKIIDCAKTRIANFETAALFARILRQLSLSTQTFFANNVETPRAL